MIEQINDVVAIFDAFRSNDDFYLELVKEALIAGKNDEAKKITRARDEFRNNYNISKETTELIKENFDKYIKLVNALKEKEKNNSDFTVSNDTYDITNDEELKENDTYTVLNNQNEEINSVYEENKNTNNNSNDSEIINSNVINDEIEENIIDENNYTFSSLIAKQNLENELSSVINQINVIKSNINNSEKLPKKKAYEELFQLESYRDKLQARLDNINLEDSYKNDNRISNQDKRLSDISDKIKENQSKLQTNMSKFKKNRISSRIQKLKNEQGRIQNSQRKIVNKDLIKFYKDSFKLAKTDSKENAINEYYQDKLDLLEDKKSEILDRVDEYNTNFITDIKNKFHKFRTLPTSARISYIKGIKESEKLNGLQGKLNGFNHLNKDIANKLYPVKQSLKDKIEELKQQKQGLINIQGMQDMINNLATDTPQLEEVSSMHR